jgi:hypothetical protein
MLNGSPAATVSADLMAILVSADGDHLPVRAALCYHLSDPYAIHVTFTNPYGSQIPWVFGRELLVDGMLGSAGVGDVQVWCTSPDDQHDVYISLISLDGEALLQFSGAALASFLGKTYAECLPGDEPLHLDVDVAITRLLAS